MLMSPRALFVSVIALFAEAIAANWAAVAGDPRATFSSAARTCCARFRSRLSVPHETSPACPGVAFRMAWASAAFRLELPSVMWPFSGAAAITAAVVAEWLR